VPFLSALEVFTAFRYTNRHILYFTYCSISTLTKCNYNEQFSNHMMHATYKTLPNRHYEYLH